MDKLTNAERISRFKEKHKEVDQSYFPNVILYWSTKNKKGVGKIRHFADPKHQKKDGELSKELLDFLEGSAHRFPGRFKFKNKEVLVSYSGQYLRCQYIVYNAKLGVMEVSQAIYDTSRYHAGEEPRKWVRDKNVSTIYFIKGNGKIPFNENGSPVNWFYVYKKVWDRGYTQIEVTLPQYATYITNAWLVNKSSHALGMFAKDSLIRESGYPINPYTTYAFYEWIHYCIPMYKKPISKTAKEYAELNNSLAKLKDNSNTELSMETKVFIEKVGDKNGHLVFRYLSSNKDLSIEGYREYLLPNGKVKAFRLVTGGWNSCPVRNKEGYTHSYAISKVEGKELLADFPSTKHVYEIARDNYPEEEFIYRILKLSQAPIIEKFFKSNFASIAKELDSVAMKSEELLAKEFFGPKTKVKGLAASLGVNKKQLAELNSTLAARSKGDVSYGKEFREKFALARGIRTIKILMGKQSIAGMDMQLFKTLLKDMAVINCDYDLEKKIIPVLQEYAGTTLCKKIAKAGNSTPISFEQSRYRWESMREIGGIHTTWQLISDTCKLLYSLPAEIRPKLDVKRWDTNYDIQKDHDSIVAFSNARQEEIYRAQNAEKAKALERIDKKRRMFEYQDDKFLIRLPKSPMEIASEGRELSHCVGGYADAHVSGRTTIFFLRDKRMPETSFYTIEVKNLGHETADVVQIHGKFNRWLGNNPEAIPTVMRWLKETGIHCTDKILLCKATGYSAYNAELVEKPQI